VLAKVANYVQHFIENKLEEQKDIEYDSFNFQNCEMDLAEKFRFGQRHRNIPFPQFICLSVWQLAGGIYDMTRKQKFSRFTEKREIQMGSCPSGFSVKLQSGFAIDWAQPWSRSQATVPRAWTFSVIGRLHCCQV
jgi:hypothetical protein